MDLHEANLRAGGPGQQVGNLPPQQPWSSNISIILLILQPSPGQLGSPHEVNNLKQELQDTKKKVGDILSCWTEKYFLTG